MRDLQQRKWKSALLEKGNYVSVNKLVKAMK